MKSSLKQRALLLLLTVLFMYTIGKQQAYANVNIPDQGNIAIGANTNESDPGWGGGSYPGEIVDGLRTYSEWYHGLAFTGGSNNYGGMPPGWRQATLDFGQPKTFDTVVVWHHGLEHVPNTYKIQYWDGNAWIDIFSTTVGRSYIVESAIIEDWDVRPTANTFTPVTASKVRFALENSDITHGWIYEFEVFGDVMQPPTAEVVSGVNRFDTAALISKRLNDSANTVILTTGRNFPDALSAGPLAVQKNAPILLAEVNKIPTETLNEINRLGASKVIILGGLGAIDSSVEAALKNLGLSVERISGATRFLTAIETAKQVRASSGQLDRAILANGYGFADALSIGSYAAKAGIPILLTAANSLSPETKTAMVQFGIKEIDIIGGELAVSKAVEDELAVMGITVSRISGVSRFATSAAIAGKYFTASENAIVSNGRGFVDALAAVPLAVKQNAPILLVEKDSLPMEISNYLDSSIINQITIVGGELAVSTTVRNEILTVLEKRLKYKLFGLSISPYVGTQDPNLGTIIPIAQLRQRQGISARYSLWDRSFGSTHGLENFGQVAHEYGKNAAVGAWLSGDLDANASEMAGLIEQAKKGYVDLAIVGSEVLLRDDLTAEQLISYIQQFRSAVPDVPVTTADVYGELMANPAVMDACDVVMANYYPYWEGWSIDKAIANLNRQYEETVAAAGAKEVIVSETGWPSAGDLIGEAVPSAQNASYYFLNFVSWARAKNVSYFYFEAFDEPWKSKYEGEQGAHWGIFDQDGLLKSGNQAVFDGVTVPNNWDCAPIPGGDGTPAIQFTDVPPLGSYDNLKGQALNVRPADYKVAVYINVGGGWWTKPYYANPKIDIGCDGTWVCDYTTGGSDQNASEIAAYLIPATYSPPAAGGGTLPTAELEANAVDWVIANR